MKRKANRKTKKEKKQKTIHLNDYIRSIFQSVLKKCDSDTRKTCRVLCKTIALLVGNMDLFEIKLPTWQCVPNQISHAFRYFSTVYIPNNLLISGLVLPQRVIVKNLKICIFNCNKIDYIPSTVEKLAINFVGANLEIKEIEISKPSIKVDTLILDSELILKSGKKLVEFGFLQNLKIIKKRKVSDYCDNLLKTTQNVAIKGLFMQNCEIPHCGYRVMISNQEIEPLKDRFICKELVFENIRFDGNFFNFMQNLNNTVQSCTVTFVFTIILEEFRIISAGLHFIDKNFTGLYPESKKWNNIKDLTLIFKCKLFSFKKLTIVSEDRTFITISRDSEIPFIACHNTKASDWISITQMPNKVNEHTMEKNEIKNFSQAFSDPWNHWIKSIYDYCERII